ncbi:MAG: putative phage abortive infection protein, partial [Burkholderiales bacterium]
MKRPNEPQLGYAIALVVFVVVVWAASGFLIYNYAGAERGIFGDMFGAVNALFSGLAFVGFLYTILLQRADLKLQKHEHDLGRAEMAAQREQMVRQNDTLRLQSFENTFFQLLRLQNDIVNTIDLTSTETGVVMVKGRDCFRVFYASFIARWKEQRAEDAGPEIIDRIRRTYLNFSAEIEAEAGHYFMTLYNILKYVDSSDVEHKKRYTNLVRAQLSS